MCKTFIALVVTVVIGMICASPAAAQAFNHTFGGANDASVIRTPRGFRFPEHHMREPGDGL